jgi:hypothetical protein
MAKRMCYTSRLAAERARRAMAEIRGNLVASGLDASDPDTDKLALALEAFSRPSRHRQKTGDGDDAPGDDRGP